MKNLMKRKFWIGTVVVLLAGTVLYGCEDFLEQPPQGSLDANTLANANGVEATLIAAYRTLDVPNGYGALQGGAARNWNFGAITSAPASRQEEKSNTV